MARSRQSFSASSFARGGMALALAATLAVGSVPATALVQSQLGAGAPVAMAAEGDGYDLEVGDTFTVTASYSAAGNTADKNMDAIVQGMVGGCLGAGVTGKVLDDGSYQLTIPRLETASDAIQAISFNSVSVSPENGGYTFTVESLDETILANAVINNPTMAGMFPNGVDFAVNLDTSDLPVAPDTPAVDKTDLNAAIASAKAIEQGSKSDDAWAALQEAIDTAERAAANENIPQQGIDAVLAQLNTAVATFNASEDVPNEPGGDAGDPGDAVDDYGMAVGKTYSANVSYAGTGSFAGDDMNAILQGMLQRYFGNTVELERLADGTYNVIFSFAEYSDAIGDMTYNGTAIKQSAERTYTINVESIASPLSLELAIGGAMSGMQAPTFTATIDTSSIKEISGVPGDGQDDAVNPGDNNNQNNNGGGASTPTQTARFAVGHTYQVPIAIMKQNGSETSMAAQYFGSSAYVRPLDNGTMEVGFSTNRTDYISGLTYQGAAVPQSGATFTLTIPYTESDTVLPLGMTIVPMQELGMGTVTADMHLYLSQATDLGSGVTSAPSSATTMAKTGDDAPVAGVVGVAALAAAGVAAAGAAGMARRRQS